LRVYLTSPRPGIHCFGFVGQSERGQQRSREAGAEAPERLPTRDGLGQALGQFIELVVHNFPFVFGLVFDLRLRMETL